MAFYSLFRTHYSGLFSATRPLPIALSEFVEGRKKHLPL
jgi:hypothetical protein